MTTKELYQLGEVPPLGEVPKKMFAQPIRSDRLGIPVKAYREEIIDIPSIGPKEVLVYVMAAGVNYNGVWASLGKPLNVIEMRKKRGEPEDFHIGGSEAAGIVWATGSQVTKFKVGDEIIAHCSIWDEDDPWIQDGQDPMLAPSQQIWGFETNWGSFAQFAKVQERQLLPKPPHLSWEEASCYMSSGATAYRMLYHWAPHHVRKDDVVLIWGGAGGLGSLAIQIAKIAGAKPVAVVSSDEKIEHCKKLGAIGAINRTRFTHWGPLPDWRDTEKYNTWLKSARAFGAAIWEIVGEKKNPHIVIEHPGENTVPTSIFVCDRGGMVVICAGTTGYNANVDLRYLWMHQKRFQGSHFANDVEGKAINDLVMEKKIDPCLSKVFQFSETGECHQLMHENRHPFGNMSILVNATRTGLRTLQNSP